MAKKQAGTSLVQFDAELAKQAQAYRDAEAASATGNFVSVKAGILQWRGAAIAGNKMNVLIVGSVFENDYYASGFDPDNPESPVCYAFGERGDGMKPNEDSGDKQGDAN